jgi:hypothetical protein
MTIAGSPNNTSRVLFKDEVLTFAGPWVTESVIIASIFTSIACRTFQNARVSCVNGFKEIESGWNKA